MCAIIGFDSPTLTEQEIRPYFDRTISRGPDMSRMEKAGRGMLGFHRLAIMGLHEEGMQPFHLGGDMAVCNGELYGFRPLKKELEAKGQARPYSEVLADVMQRDEQDSTRASAPLRQAEDAVRLDTTYLNFEESFVRLREIICRRAGL